jgi:hypothetical protein
VCVSNQRLTQTPANSTQGEFDSEAKLRHEIVEEELQEMFADEGDNKGSVDSLWFLYCSLSATYIVHVSCRDLSRLVFIRLQVSFMFLFLINK